MSATTSPPAHRRAGLMDVSPAARDSTVELRNANLDPLRERGYLRGAPAPDCAAIIHAPSPRAA